MTENEKIILTGRVYPAIDKCVGNRYKIIVGYFAVLGLVFFNKDYLKPFVDSGAALFIAIIFTIFTIHNTINYWNNALLQWKLENVDGKIPFMEIFSFIIISALIWSGYCFLKIYLLTVNIA